ncbi:protein FAR1-RELATED SEQUENCE 5-like [Zingiber officinale]|uniref:protein FAR1-RELATED SEQUENCE 5-like n=1 Tax=Zingiber officinale TaxID=94328 RepID=UPI001C4C7774|nr:protein FAR1-RELATED SEQUENCE 5-like [Zingiber officinale]
MRVLTYTIPQVGEERKPQIGMEFPSLEEAFAFYNQYARESGFSARLGNTAQVDSVKERARGEVRTGCRAKLSLVKEQTEANWIVTKFLESHNHPLSTPSKVHLLHSHRHVSEAKKVLTQQFAEANIPTCQQVRLLEIDSGGPEFLGCTEWDIRNFERELRDEQKGIDAETLIEFFATEKEKNPGFFYAYEIDSTGRFTRCFWADHVSRRAYSVFGVNHHHQSIVFGCAFLSDEKTESFVWLPTKFIEAMPKGPPTVIITDQDPALMKAIGQVLPQTVHRYCLWHILNKFQDKLPPLTFRNYYQMIKDVIVNSSSPAEFDKTWEEVIRCSGLENNDWLTLMYEIRQRWVPLFFNHVFSAGMSSSQ